MTTPTPTAPELPAQPASDSALGRIAGVGVLGVTGLAQGLSVLLLGSQLAGSAQAGAAPVASVLDGVGRPLVVVALVAGVLATLSLLSAVAVHLGPWSSRRRTAAGTDPELPHTPLVEGPWVVVLSGALALAGVAGVARAVAEVSPGAGADLVLVVVAAYTLPTRATRAVALSPALVGWFLAVFVATARGGLDVPEQSLGWIIASLTLAGVGVTGALARQALDLVEHSAAVSQEALESMLVHDALTGVVNLKGLDMLAGPMIEHARRQGQAVHCLFVDVDDFTQVNHVLGHDIGDDVLVTVSEALLASVRGTDAVSRISGDEFVIVGPGTGTSPLELERRVREQLVQDLGVPETIWPGRVSVGSSTLVPWDEGDLQSLVRRAEQDMRLRRSLRRQAGLRASASAAIPPSAPPARAEEPGAPEVPPSAATRPSAVTRPSAAAPIVGATPTSEAPSGTAEQAVEPGSPGQDRRSIELPNTD